VVPNLGAAGLPGLDRLGDDLGSEQVLGEPGALVEGYGPALDRLTQELARLMRQNKILVVWLFDESESMRDDQKDLQGRIQRVYEELKLFKEDVPEDVMLSAVVSFARNRPVMFPPSSRRSMPFRSTRPAGKTPVERSSRSSTSIGASPGRAGDGW
jgi:hypothetical protein